MRKLVLVALALAPLLAFAGAPQHFTLAALFAPPAKSGANGAVAVTFTPLNADVHINENPAPRLKLDPEQKVLVDKQPPPPTRVEPYDPDKVRYLDLALPVIFPVAVAADAPKGPQSVKANIVYFYCSKAQGWCRRGATDVDVALTVR